MQIELVKMELRHLDAVAALEEACFAIPWTRASIKKEIEDNKMAVYFVAQADGETIGYGGMWHVVNEGHITNICVAEEYRKQGIGDMLLRRLIDEAHAREMIGLTLEVRVSNGAAQRLYTRNGFKPEGIRKNYYAETKEDAVIMWLNFLPGDRD